jgi:formate/nitrite transporter FocA (FNT family)
MVDENRTPSDSAQSNSSRNTESGWAEIGEPKQADTTETGGTESPQKNLARPTAEDIYQQVSLNAKAELKRSTVSLGISGFAGGIFMGLSGLGSAITLGLFGFTPLSHFVAMMFYPLGFIVVILGRAQLFTENTLYPVALVLSEKRELGNTLRLWCTVLPANVLGALAFAVLAGRTSALPPAALGALVQLGLTAVHVSPATVFWSAVTAGWIIATAAWLVSGSHSITGSVIIIWMLTFVVGLGSFAHCIATSGEILSAVLTRQLDWLSYFHWLGLAVAGNVCGGVLMVTLLEYGQAILAKAEVPLEGEEADI